MIKLLPITMMCLFLAGCNTTKLTQPVFEEQPLPPGHPWRMDTVSDPSVEQGQMSPRTPEEQRAIEAKNAAKLKLLRAEAEMAMAGCRKIEDVGQHATLTMTLPKGARLILVTCSEAQTRLRLTADGKDVSSSNAAGLPEPYLHQGLLAYTPKGVPVCAVKVQAIVDMGHPEVPPLSAVGCITVFYK